MEQKPLWFILITWTLHLVDHAWERSHAPWLRKSCQCLDKLHSTSWISLLIHCSFPQDFLWNYLIKEAFRMVSVRTPAWIENVFTKILFLRNKSWWQRWFPSTDKKKTKSILYIKALWDIHFAPLPYLDVLVESETCFDMCSPWVKSDLSFYFMMHVFFFLLSG